MLVEFSIVPIGSGSIGDKLAEVLKIVGGRVTSKEITTC